MATDLLFAMLALVVALIGGLVVTTSNVKRQGHYDPLMIFHLDKRETVIAIISFLIAFGCLIVASISG